MAGNQLRDQTCTEVAEYFARLVGWYTAGGFVDECGEVHHSGLHYKWDYLSVLNEDEHAMRAPNASSYPAEEARKLGGAVQYTICYDRIKQHLQQVNPDIVLIGPEGVSMDFTRYFLNGSNHEVRASVLWSHGRFV